MDHTLILLCKGRVTIPHDAPHNYLPLRVADFGFDLRAYRRAAQQLTGYTHLCCLNSHTVITGDNWLSPMAAAFQAPGVGMVGAFESTESFYTNAVQCGEVSGVRCQVSGVPNFVRKILFPPAPNHHLRTNGFIMPRGLMLSVWPRFTFTKHLCYLAESGRWSISRRVRSRGWKTVCVPTGLKDNRCGSVKQTPTLKLKCHDPVPQ